MFSSKSIDMERHRPLVQIYSQYTAEDRRVWHALFERQHRLLQSHASRRYLKALDAIGFSAERIPEFCEVNERLKAATDWNLCVVTGHVPPAEFFARLASRQFPATCWLRTFAELDYIEEPDMFHDVFGHVPLLIDPEYASFMQRFGEIALEFIDDEDAIEALSRLYWFTIEFGLIVEAGDRRIYGAGILSSPGETRHSMSAAPECAGLDLDRVMGTGFRTDVIQDLYFSIPSFAVLNPALEQVFRALSFRKNGALQSIGAMA